MTFPFRLILYNLPAPPNHKFPFLSFFIPIIEIGTLSFLNFFLSNLYTPLLVVLIHKLSKLSLKISYTSPLLNPCISGKDSIPFFVSLFTPPFPVRFLGSGLSFSATLVPNQISPSLSISISVTLFELSPSFF